MASSACVQDSVAGEKIRQITALGKERIALPSTRIRNRIDQKEYKRLTSRNTLAKSLVIFRNGEEKRTDEAVIKITQEARKLCEITQVEMLFPEFFPQKKSLDLCRQSDWYNDHQSNMEMENGKVKEDPLVRSWLNLFGARSRI